MCQHIDVKVSNDLTLAHNQAESPTTKNEVGKKIIIDSTVLIQSVS